VRNARRALAETTPNGHAARPALPLGGNMFLRESSDHGDTSRGHGGDPRYGFTENVK